MFGSESVHSIAKFDVDAVIPKAGDRGVDLLRKDDPELPQGSYVLGQLEVSESPFNVVESLSDFFHVVSVTDSDNLVLRVVQSVHSPSRRVIVLSHVQSSTDVHMIAVRRMMLDT